MDKLIIALISPLGTSLVLGLLSMWLAWLSRIRWAWRLGAMALVWLWVWSLPVASHALRRAVEAAHPAVALEALPRAQALVVLGGGIRPAGHGEQMPDLQDGADRAWYAAQLYRAGKAPLVVLSGGSNPAVSATSEAEAMRVFMSDLGVPASAMLLEGSSRNTRQNAALTADLLRPRGVQHIVLVTSALHMRRAVGLFEAQGFRVTPAATDHEARSTVEAVDWLPDAGALESSAAAMKELVGRITGR